MVYGRIQSTEGHKINQQARILKTTIALTPIHIFKLTSQFISQENIRIIHAKTIVETNKIFLISHPSIHFLKTKNIQDERWVVKLIVVAFQSCSPLQQSTFQVRQNYQSCLKHTAQLLLFFPDAQHQNVIA